MTQKQVFKETEIGNTPENWKERKIGDCIELIYGKGLPERQRKKGNIPVFGSNGIVGFHNEAIVKSPGIIIGRKGSVGEITFSKLDFWPIDTTYYVQTKQGNDIGFWYYFLKTLGLNQMNTHSAVPGLNRDNVYEIVRTIPNFIEQRTIASILGSLDDKIALNRSMNSTLEAIGQALFRRWFVDFEFPDGGRACLINRAAGRW
jgi:type I restriction enzyme S subunit